MADSRAHDGRAFEHGGLGVHSTYPSYVSRFEALPPTRRSGQFAQSVRLRRIDSVHDAAWPARVSPSGRATEPRQRGDVFLLHGFVDADAAFDASPLMLTCKHTFSGGGVPAAAPKAVARSSGDPPNAPSQLFGHRPRLVDCNS